MSEYQSGDFATWFDVIEALKQKSGVITCTMESLRVIDQYGRLGNNVRASIGRKLSGMGISTLTEELPHESGDSVILIRQGLAASELVEVITTALAGGGATTLDGTAEKLRALNSVPDPASLKAAVDVARDAIAAAEGIMGDGDRPPFIRELTTK